MKTTLLASAMILLPVLALAADPSYFRFSTPAPLGDDGKWVTFRLEEVDRTDTASVVEVYGAPRSTDTSAGYLLTGMCALAKARNQRFFQARQVDSAPLTFEVRFPKTAPNTASMPLSAIAPNVFSVSQCRS